MTNRINKALAGLMTCFFIFSFTACSIDPTAVESTGKNEDGDKLFSQTVTVENIYKKEEFTPDKTIEVLSRTGLFTTETLVYTLEDVRWEPMTIVGRTIDLTSVVDYGFTTVKPDVASQREISYEDPRTGKTVISCKTCAPL